MSARVATVASVSPLTVRETIGSKPLPAKVITGSSYAPAVGDRVLVEFPGGPLFYILGGA